MSILVNKARSAAVLWRTRIVGGVMDAFQNVWNRITGWTWNSNNTDTWDSLN